MVSLLLALCVLQATSVAGQNNGSVEVTDQTVSSTTTAPPPVTTTVNPTPTVPVYNAMNGTEICLRIQMNVKLTIEYFNKQGNSVSKTFFLNASSHHTMKPTGLCEKDAERIKIQWWPEVSEPKIPAWALELKFKRVPSDNSDDQFTLDTVAFNYTVTDQLFPETNETVTRFTSNKQSQFSAPIGDYFQCMSKQTWKLSDTPDLPVNSTRPDVLISISNLRVEAFRSGSNDTFVGRKSECSADFVPNKVVPIVIGVALAVMIVIALATFIIGSRRRQGGYQEI